MRVSIGLDHVAAIIDSGTCQETRYVEGVRQPIDGHRKVAFQFIDQIFGEIGVGTLVVGVDRDGFLEFIRIARTVSPDPPFGDLA